MTAVCQVLGLARSNVQALSSRPASWVDGRTQRTASGDEQLLSDIREQITELPSYGYRRACALINRKRTSGGAARVNAKRVYRVMARQCLAAAKGAAAHSVEPGAHRHRLGPGQRHALVLGWL